MMTATNQLLDEKALRKAWLKKKFASWEYHEELLKLHDEYLSALHRHWARDDIQRQYPEDYQAMISPVFFNFDKVPKPGELTKANWEKKKTVGWADAISYNFNRGMDFAGSNEYAGMADAERDRLNRIVGLMLRRSENIRVTVENRWDDSDDEILNERYTGPIEWPTNWKDEVLGSRGAALAGANAMRVKAGDPVPSSGLWQAIDPRATQQRAVAGDTLPDLGSAYGTTIWQCVGE